MVLETALTHPHTKIGQVYPQDDNPINALPHNYALLTNLDVDAATGDPVITAAWRLVTDGRHMSA